MSAPVNVMADLRILANIGEYRELRNGMEKCLRSHEREGFADLLERMPKNLEAVTELTESAAQVLANGSYEDFQRLRAALVNVGGRP